MATIEESKRVGLKALGKHIEALGHLAQVLTDTSDERLDDLGKDLESIARRIRRL